MLHELSFQKSFRKAEKQNITAEWGKRKGNKRENEE